MFIHFEFLNKQRERTELIVSTPKEALNLACLFEASDAVIAWKMLSHKPEDFGAAPISSPMWKKLRYTYRPEDYEVNPENLGSGDEEQSEELIEFKYRRTGNHWVKMSVPKAVVAETIRSFESDNGIEIWTYNDKDPNAVSIIGNWTGLLMKVRYVIF